MGEPAVPDSRFWQPRSDTGPTTADAVEKAQAGPDPHKALGPGRTTGVAEAVGSALGRTGARIAALRKRFERPGSAPGARQAPGEMLALRADELRMRAGHYADRYPLETIAICAASGLLLGFFLGWWRRA